MNILYISDTHFGTEIQSTIEGFTLLGTFSD